MYLTIALNFFFTFPPLTSSPFHLYVSSHIPTFFFCNLLYLCPNLLPVPSHILLLLLHFHLISLSLLFLIFYSRYFFFPPLSCPCSFSFFYPATVYFLPVISFCQFFTFSSRLNFTFLFFLLFPSSSSPSWSSLFPFIVFNYFISTTLLFHFLFFFKVLISTNVEFVQ